jgi:predicted amidohydrolase YtcJ
MFRPGFAADLVVLDGAPIAQGPEALLKTNVRLTMMDGRIIYLG